ncbi:AbrB/MazE/SpoVT family DNA-binding domain-containing protein [Glycomyces arizonensis]|uniref:AbrB/MazE/SpoVT family DNA-binding domain-containing protein n=1 Tax=Glycomyces arizonensis TaxID=256035 RepID=UPI0012EB345E|nr:AbrB/MazE/SpoVT family DNA-binding domain-containing protein [Glycomyces arizonensis]
MKHQITLPVAVMREAGIEVGDELFVRADREGRVVLVRERDRIDQWAGSFPGLTAATDLEGLRGEWDE